jgi:hypothetical protein
MKLIDLLQICTAVSNAIENNTKKLAPHSKQSDYRFYENLQDRVFLVTDPLDVLLGKWQRFSDPL